MSRKSMKIEQGISVTYKVLIIGETSVGKTCILQSLAGKSFRSSTISTVGVDFENVNFTVRGVNLLLKIWDTAGQEQFRAITKSFYRGAEAVVLVYDITSKTSFDKLNVWFHTVVEDLVDNNANRFKIPFYVFGNKIDLVDKRVVTQVDGQAFQDQKSADGFFEVSAKTGENILNAFHCLAEDILLENNPELVSNYLSLEYVVEVQLQGNCACKCNCKCCKKCSYKHPKPTQAQKRVRDSSLKTRRKELKSARSVVHLVSETHLSDKTKCSDCGKS